MEMSLEEIKDRLYDIRKATESLRNMLLFTLEKQVDGVALKHGNTFAELYSALDSALYSIGKASECLGKAIEKCDELINRR